eukprot:30980-Pelagococcus_subviridis.AAC.26
MYHARFVPSAPKHCVTFPWNAHDVEPRRPSREVELRVVRAEDRAVFFGFDDLSERREGLGGEFFRGEAHDAPRRRVRGGRRPGRRPTTSTTTTTTPRGDGEPRPDERGRGRGRHRRPPAAVSRSSRWRERRRRPRSSDLVRVPPAGESDEARLARRRFSLRSCPVSPRSVRRARAYLPSRDDNKTNPPLAK